MIAQELLVLGAQTAIGGLATYAFTTLNPLYGLVYGVSLYAISACAHHCLKGVEMSPQIRSMIHVVAIVPAGVLTAGLLALIGVPISVGMMMQVGAAVLLGTVAFFLTLFMLRCLRFVINWSFLNFIDSL